MTSRIVAAFAALHVGTIIVSGCVLDGPALAQNASTASPSATGSASDSGANASTKKLPVQSSQTAAQASGMNTTDPKNGGVAGTGMGGSTNGAGNSSTGLGGDGKTVGTGMSVPGPAGSGISGGQIPSN